MQNNRGEVFRLIRLFRRDCFPSCSNFLLHIFAVISLSEIIICVYFRSVFPFYPPLFVFLSFSLLSLCFLLMEVREREGKGKVEKSMKTIK